MPCTIQVCTNSRRPAFCWKWTQRSVLLLLLLLLQLHVHAYARPGVASPAEPCGRDTQGLNPQFSDTSVRYEYQHSSACDSIFTYLHKLILSRYNIIWHNITRHNIMWHNVMWHKTMWNNIMWHLCNSKLSSCHDFNYFNKTILE